MADTYVELLTPRPFTATTFDNDEGYDQLIIVRDIPFQSLCMHHVLPFHGVAHIGYLPSGRILGLSKLARVVDLFARDLQLQERLTTQVADWLQDELQPLGVGVVMEAEHLCMSLRGVQKPGAKTVTSALHGSCATTRARETSSSASRERERGERIATLAVAEAALRRASGPLARRRHLQPAHGRRRRERDSNPRGILSECLAAFKAAALDRSATPPARYSSRTSGGQARRAQPVADHSAHPAARDATIAQRVRCLAGASQEGEQLLDREVRPRRAGVLRPVPAGVRAHRSSARKVSFAVGLSSNSVRPSASLIALLVSLTAKTRSR